MPGCRLAGSCRLGRSPVVHGPVPTAIAADLPDFCPSLVASTLGTVVVASSAWVVPTTVFAEWLDLLFRCEGPTQHMCDARSKGLSQRLRCTKRVCVYVLALHVCMCALCSHKTLKSKPGSLELVNPLVSTPGRGFTGIYVALYI